MAAAWFVKVPSPVIVPNVAVPVFIKVSEAPPNCKPSTVNVPALAMAPVDFKVVTSTVVPAAAVKPLVTSTMPSDSTEPFCKLMDSAFVVEPAAPVMEPSAIVTFFNVTVPALLAKALPSIVQSDEMVKVPALVNLPLPTTASKVAVPALLNTSVEASDAPVKVATPVVKLAPVSFTKLPTFQAPSPMMVPLLVKVTSTV